MESNRVYLPQNLDTKYTNGVIITHTNGEFILDFTLAQPGMKLAVVSRIIIGASSVKEIMSAILENITLYEQQYGEIPVGRSQPDENKIYYLPN